MTSNMILTVEFLAGTSIEKAIQEAKEKCNSLNVAIVKFSFNGIFIVVSSYSDVAKGAELYTLAGTLGKSSITIPNEIR